MYVFFVGYCWYGYCYVGYDYCVVIVFGVFFGICCLVVECLVLLVFDLVYFFVYYLEGVVLDIGLGQVCDQQDQGEVGDLEIGYCVDIVLEYVFFVVQLWLDDVGQFVFVGLLEVEVCQDYDDCLICCQFDDLVVV